MKRITPFVKVSIAVILLFAALALAACGYLASKNIAIEELPPDLEKLVSSHVDSLIESDFRDLLEIDIQLSAVTKSTDTVFFETYVKATTIFLPAKYRTYHLLANKALVENRPSEEALKAILAHELTHILDYTNKGTLELIELDRQYGDDSFRRTYERDVDRRTVELGYGLGLSEYRYWLYSEIADDEKISVKRFIYMTPDEIESAITVLD